MKALLSMILISMVATNVLARTPSPTEDSAKVKYEELYSAGKLVRAEEKLATPLEERARQILIDKSYFDHPLSTKIYEEVVESHVVKSEDLTCEKNKTLVVSKSDLFQLYAGEPEEFQMVYSNRELGSNGQALVVNHYECHNNMDNQ